MKRKIYLSALCATFAGFSYAGYVPAVISGGFNQDIIANGIGNASSSTTVGFDEANTRALLSLDFQATSGSSLPTYGLPVNGTITSSANSNIIFQLGDYGNYNALFLTPAYVGTGTPNGSLQFSATSVTNLYFLVASAGGDGGLVFNATIHFTDNSTQTINNLAAPDWYNNSNYAIQGIGRVNTTNDNLEGAANNPRLYQVTAAIDVANQQKTISSVDFNFPGDPNASYASQIRMSILAVTSQQAFQNNPVSITSGFNQDIIANGTGNAAQSASVGFDEANNRALLSADFKVLPTDPIPTSALPASGTINSVNTPGLTFQLADYGGNNALFLTPAYVSPASGTPTGSLACNVSNVSNVYLLAASAGGDGTPVFDATVTFSDNTSQTFSNVVVPDWYNNSGYAIQGIGRINMTNNNIEEQGTGNPRLYEINLALDPGNQTKTITGVAFNLAGDPDATYANEIRMSVLAITTVPGSGIPTAIRLSDFSGRNQGNSNLLSWSSTSESEGDMYALEHSTDGKSFTLLTQVKAKGIASAYSYIHNGIQYGAHYYRLKTTGQNETIHYSKIIQLNYNDNAAGIKCYPNPFHNTLYIENDGAYSQITISNLSGVVVKTMKLNTTKGLNAIDMKDLKSGVYYIQAINNNAKSAVLKIVKD